MTKLSRTLRTALAGTAATLGLVVAGASPAAAFTTTDGMEAAVRVWSFGAVGASGGSYVSTGARTGVRALHLYSTAPGYAVAKRVMYLDKQRDCTASVWVDPLASDTLTGVNFEIVDPATNSYIKLQTVHLNPSAGYTKISTAFVSPKANVDVRVAVGTPSPGRSVAVLVDDLTMDCS